jgi:hypothetical protein
MVGFRNIAVHDYQALQLPITIKIITTHLQEFLEYSRVILVRDGGRFNFYSFPRSAWERTCGKLGRFVQRVTRAVRIHNKYSKN